MVPQPTLPWIRTQRSTDTSRGQDISQTKTNRADTVRAEGSATMAESTINVSCDECEFDGTDTCKDCIVTFLLNREPEDAIIFDASTARAVNLLNHAGLVPALRHRRRVG